MTTKELKHVGVLGMRWGIRRGDSTSGGGSSSGRRLSYTEREQRRREVTKKAVKLVAVSLAAYGTYKLGKHLKDHPEKIALAQNKIKSVLSGKKMKTRKFTSEEIKKNQEWWSKIRKQTQENQKIFEELKGGQKDYQFTPSDLQRAIDTLKRQGVG